MLKHRPLRQAALLILGTALVPLARSQGSAWTQGNIAFVPISITSAGSTIWVTGSREGIASSTDGRTWTSRHVSDGAGALMLGIAFADDRFGYAWGTGGTVLITTDGGSGWKTLHLGGDTILRASLSDPEHGLIRTSSSVFQLKGAELAPVVIPETVAQDFKFAPDVVALSPERMAISLSQGWRSETGFLSTTNGGASWTFYDPPHIVPYQLLRSGERYWAVGTETVGYDKPGGGYGVPLVMSSLDGRSWTHTTSDVRPCHWEGCHLCRVTGCLASASQLIEPFGDAAKLYTIPTGHVTPQWAASPELFCAIDGKSVMCAQLHEVTFVDKAGDPQPEEQQLPRLGTEPKVGLLRCIRCSWSPIFVDPKFQGDVTAKIVLKVIPEGTVDIISISGVPSDGVQQQLRQEISQWLFEPPAKDGKPVTVNTAVDARLRVIRSR